MLVIMKGFVKMSNTIYFQIKNIVYYVEIGEPQTSIFIGCCRSYD